MAQIKVSALTELTATDGNEELLINDGGTSKKVTIDNVLHDNSIRAEHYVDGSIATAHIADNAITSAKLGVDVIVAEDIANNAITVAELAANAVTTVKILDDNVTNAKMADNAIDTAQIADDAVTAAKLANSINTEITANTAKVTNATHTGDVTGATTLTIGSNKVITAKILDSNVTTAKIADDAVTADKLANSINTAIAANTAKTGITSGQASAITANTAKTSNATHSGEVTGATALTIAANVVDEANLKVSNTPTNGYVLTAQSGNTGGLTWAADANTTYSVGDGGLTQNNFTNTLKTKLDAIEAAADVTDTTNVTAAGALMDSELAGIAAVKATTGTFLSADESKLDGIAASANNYVHPNHSGEVTSSADGATVVANNVIDEANLKVSNSPTNGYILVAQSGNTGGLTWTEPAATSLGNNSVDSANYVDGSIDREHLAADIVDGTKIADNSINSEHYAAGSIDAEHLASDSVTEAKIAANSIDSQAYVDGSIDTAHLGDDQVTAAKLANSINTDIATGVTGNTTANAALPKAGGAMTGATTHADNVKDTYGTGGDLEMYHDGSASYIRDVGTGNLLLSSDGAAVILQTSQGEKCVEAVKDGTVNLYHNNVKKFETTSTGIDVTGVISPRNATKTFNGGISTEADSALINFGINEGSGNRFGGSYTQANQGGMLNFDSRSGQPLFQIYGRAAGTADATGTSLLDITSDGRGLSQFTAKAWVNFEGTDTVTIRDSHNISSVTDVAGGRMRPNFTNNLANVNYAVVASCSTENSGNTGMFAMTNTSHTGESSIANAVGHFFITTARTGAADATEVDSPFIHVIVFGD